MKIGMTAGEQIYNSFFQPLVSGNRSNRGSPFKDKDTNRKED